MAKGGVHHASPHRAPMGHAPISKVSHSRHAPRPAPIHTPTVSTSHASITRPTLPNARPAGVTSSGITHQSSAPAGGGFLSKVAGIAQGAAGMVNIPMPDGSVATMPTSHARAFGYMPRKKKNHFSVTSRDLKSLTKIARLVSLVSHVDKKHRHVVLHRKRHSRA